MSKANFWNDALIVLFILSLSGCVSVSSSPTSKFYMLSSISKEQPAQKFEINSGVNVAVGPVGIPEYLDRPQIVTRNKNGTLTFAQFDRWAEPLDSGLARLISDDLAGLLPAANFYLFPCNFAIPLDYQVIVEVTQLDSELDKDMIFAGQWSIIDAKSRKLLLTKRTQLSEPVNPHNYFGLANAFSAACASLSKEIAGELSHLAKQPKPVKEPVEKQP